MRHLLKTKQDIEAALKVAPVFCFVAELEKGRSFVLRDVRMSDGHLEVKLLEGWRRPDEVWTRQEVKRDEAGIIRGAV